MAELTQKERLQPSLLDRLTDEEPDKVQESRDKRVLSVQRLRSAVLRDLSWLLNATNLACIEDLEPYPLVASSVLNYGMPDLTGHTASSIEFTGMERLVRQAVWDFEPRILRNSLKVKLIADDEAMNHNAMIFDIEGDLWAQPVPQRIFLRTELDLEAGQVKVSDYVGPRSG